MAPLPNPPHKGEGIASALVATVIFYLYDPCFCINSTRLCQRCEDKSWA